MISEISFLSFFFHSGIYFPFSKLHSKGFHEFCASFFGRKTADCQKLRGEIKSTQSSPGFISRLWSTSFANPPGIFLKFHALWSFTARNLSRFNTQVAEFLPLILFEFWFIEVDIFRVKFFPLSFFLGIFHDTLCIPSNKIEISPSILMQRRIIKEDNNWQDLENFPLSISLIFNCLSFVRNAMIKLDWTRLYYSLAKHFNKFWRLILIKIVPRQLFVPHLLKIPPPQFHILLYLWLFIRSFIVFIRSMNLST